MLTWQRKVRKLTRRDYKRGLGKDRKPRRDVREGTERRRERFDNLERKKKEIEV